jgi:hypothetical protein
MKNKLALIVGGIAVLSALALAPVAAAKGLGHEQGVVGPQFSVSDKAPVMQIGSTVVATPPPSVEAIPFAKPAL